MIKSKKFGSIARQLAFVGALLVGCQSPDAAKQKLMRDAKNGTQMPSWETTKQSEVRMPDISSETYMAAGRLHETQGRLTRAAAQYRLAIQLKPDDVEAHNRLGLVLCQLRQFNEADIELGKAIELAPNQAHLHNNLGFSYLAQSRWAEAEQQFDKALQINPQFARCHVNLGMVLAQQEKYDEALRHFQMVVPTEDAWFNIGLMYQSKSQQADAARAFKTALKLHPKMVAAQQCLDKLPASVVAPAQPFESVTALAAASKTATSVVEPPQSATPAESVASTSPPSTTGTTQSPESIDTDPDALPAGSPAVVQSGSPSTSTPQVAETPQAVESPAEEPAEAVAEAGETTFEPPAAASEDSSDVEPIEPGLLTALMTTQWTETPGSTPDEEAFLLPAASQPEENINKPAAPMPAAAVATESPASPTISSTSQPSISSPYMTNDADIKNQYVIRPAPIDLANDLTGDNDEIVLSARPPMPPAARNVVLQATRPASDEPTPEELRTVIEALLELSQTQATSQMPKPYSAAATQPAAAAPQSQPSAGQTRSPGKLNMSVEVSMGQTGDDWNLSIWNDFASVFAPGETFGSAASDR